VIVGLTGGIGTGKSTAADALARHGVHVIDTDAIARFLTDCDPAIRDRIRAGFGSEVFHPNGGLDRERLGESVFTDAVARAKLEQILHPPILDWVRLNCAAARAHSRHLVVVVPLLFELDMRSWFDQTWMVTCMPAIQLERLQTHRGYSQEEAERRIAAQWPLARKAALADRVFTNDATIADFENEIITTLESLTTA
jgi:dephospho-CoA kinase